MIRKQRVVLPNSASSWTFIKAGVSQGSILGPLLFLIYINDIVDDIVDDIQSCIGLFTDDTTLYIIADNPISAVDEQNVDLAKIHAWTARWLVSFNQANS